MHGNDELGGECVGDLLCAVRIDGVLAPDGKHENVDISEYMENIPFDSESEYFSDYMKITDFTFLGDQKVAYPYGDDGRGKDTSKGSLTWFKANRNSGQPVKGGCSCSIGHHLPKITDEKKIIPALVVKSKTKKAEINQEEIECKNCHAIMYRKRNNIPIRQTIECDNCGKKLKVVF